MPTIDCPASSSKSKVDVPVVKKHAGRVRNWSVVPSAHVGAVVGSLLGEVVGWKEGEVVGPDVGEVVGTPVGTWRQVFTTPQGAIPVHETDT